jgi:hypothetical protein
MPIIAYSADGDNLEQLLTKLYYDHQHGSVDYPFQRILKFEPTEEELKAVFNTDELPDFSNTVTRIVRLPDMEPFTLEVPQYRIDGHWVRVLPSFLLGYKQYPIFVIEDVLNRDLPPKDITNGSDIKLPVIINDNSTKPVWETKNNWKRWFKLNLSLFLSLLLQMCNANKLQDVSLHQISHENLLNYFRIIRPNGWLRSLTDAAVRCHMKLKCAPWTYPTEKAA